MYGCNLLKTKYFDVTVKVAQLMYCWKGWKMPLFAMTNQPTSLTDLFV